MTSSKSCELKLDFCSHEAAKFAVEHWHYSKCLPTAKLVRIGVWENSSFTGCVVFGDGASNQMFKPYGLDYTEGCELVRVALGKHQTPVSRIVAIALKLLLKACPGLKLVISFADPEHNHHGGIYQAGNWFYSGMTTSSEEYLVKGKRYHGRALRSLLRSSSMSHLTTKQFAAHLDPNYKIIPGSTKHRYLYPLTSEIRAKIEPLKKPYPKSASANRTTPTDLAGAEGASPIQTL